MGRDSLYRSRGDGGRTSPGEIDAESAGFSAPGGTGKESPSASGRGAAGRSGGREQQGRQARALLLAVRDGAVGPVGERDPRVGRERLGRAPAGPGRGGGDGEVAS